MEAHEMTDELVLTLKAQSLARVMLDTALELLTSRGTGSDPMRPVTATWRKASDDARRWELVATLEFAEHVPDDERAIWAVAIDGTRRTLEAGTHPGTPDDAFVALLPREDVERRVLGTPQ